MGKKFFATMIVAVVAVFAGYNVYQSQSKVILSDLALANVEALANSSEADSRTAYGYKLTDCKDSSGRKTGTRCVLTAPSDECKYTNEWGTCGRTNF